MPIHGPRAGDAPRRPRRLAEAVAAVNGGRSPEEVYAALPAKVVSPAHAFGSTYRGYRFDPKDVDAVMKRYGIADAKLLLETAIALDRGDRYLSLDELTQAAKRRAAYVAGGVKYSPTVLADIMSRRGIAEESAMLRAAKRIDDGDRRLTREELERAGDVLDGIVHAHDYLEIVRRIEKLGAPVEVLGSVGGLPIHAVTFPARNQPPRLRVVVTGGVHGDEPCGAGAALLLAEQLAKPSRSNAGLPGGAMRDDVEVVIVPVVNPRGLVNGTRRTPDAVDLNRHFGDGPGPLEAELVERLLARVKPDLAIDLHSGKARRNGFWLIHDGGADLAKSAMVRFRESWPALTADPAPYVLQAPGVAESHNPGTLKSAAKHAGAHAAFTVEAPGSVSYLDQVLGENELTHGLIEAALAQA